MWPSDQRFRGVMDSDIFYLNLLTSFNYISIYKFLSHPVIIPILPFSHVQAARATSFAAPLRWGLRIGRKAWSGATHVVDQSACAWPERTADEMAEPLEMLFTCCMCRNPPIEDFFPFFLHVYQPFPIQPHSSSGRDSSSQKCKSLWPFHAFPCYDLTPGFSPGFKALGACRFTKIDPKVKTDSKRRSGWLGDQVFRTAVAITLAALKWVMCKWSVNVMTVIREHLRKSGGWSVTHWGNHIKQWKTRRVWPDWETCKCWVNPRSRFHILSRIMIAAELRWYSDW